MTIAEVERQANANSWKIQQQQRERANLAYIVPQLIGIQIANVFSNKAPEYPSKSAVFPELFDKEIEEEIIEQRKIETSRANFLKFAQMHNKKKKEVENIDG